MYKVVWIARYRNDMTKQRASDYWATLHGPPMKEVSPVAGYVQSHVQGPLPSVSGVAEEETCSTATPAAGGTTARTSRRR